MDLRLATYDDIAHIRQLADRIWRQHYTPILPVGQVDYMLDRFYSIEKLRSDMEQGTKFWLPAIGGTPVGFIAIKPLEEEETYFIDKFYMDNGQRGRGLGSQSFGLLSFQYPEAKAWKLLVNRENYKSVNFYFKIGFTIERLNKKDIGNGYKMDDFLMVKKES